MEYLFSVFFKLKVSVRFVWLVSAIAVRRHNVQKNEEREKENAAEREAAIAWMQFVSTWDESAVVVVVVIAAAVCNIELGLLYLGSRSLWDVDSVTMR